VLVFARRSAKRDSILRYLELVDVDLGHIAVRVRSATY